MSDTFVDKKVFASGLHAWIGSGARVNRKRRTRELEAAHAWTGSGARVNWITVATPAYDCFPSSEFQQSTLQSIQYYSEIGWICKENVKMRYRVSSHALPASSPFVRSIWLLAVITCNQLDFVIQSTWFHRLINLFFKKICVESFTPSTLFSICWISVCCCERKGWLSSFTRFHYLSR